MSEERRQRAVDVEAVAYGRPATEALRRRIVAAQQGHPLAPVTVVVASNAAGLSARRMVGGGLLGGRGLVNVSFVTPFRLAELLGSAAVSGRRPLTNPVLASAVRSVLRTAPGMFQPVAAHEATQAAVIALYAELSRAEPATIEAIAHATRRGAEVVRLLRAVRTRLSGYYDEDDLALAATAHVEREPGAVGALGAVIWHLPDRVSPAVGRLLAAVLRAATSASVVAGVSGDPDADAATAHALDAIGSQLPHAAHVATPVAHRIVSVSDPDDEVRAVVREAMSLAESGTRLERVGVFYPVADPYARTLHEQFAAAGIPHNGPTTARLADTITGRTLLHALALPDTGWARGEVIALVANAPVRHDEHTVTSTRWDIVSRDAGVVGGLDDWHAKLASFSQAMRATLADERGASDGRRAALQRDADTADALATFVASLAQAVHSIRDACTWRERADASRALLERLLGPEHRRTGWPDREVDAATRVDAALVRLSELDHLEPQPSYAAFELALTAELDERVGRIGRFGEGVLVAPLAAAAGLDLDAVFVLGMNEGTCPSFRRDDALLTDHDRRRAASGELVNREQRLHDQHRAFLAALAAGRTQRTLVYSRGDLRSRRNSLASRWLLDTASHLAGHRVFSSDVARLGPPVVHTVASFTAGIEGAVVHGCAEEHDLAALLAHVATGADPMTHPLVADSLGRGFDLQRSRAGDEFTVWDGNLAGLAIPSPSAGFPMSPSRLETWATCGFRYYLSSVLRLSERDDPERIDEIGPADKGSLIHEILERFIGGAIDRPEGPPAPHEPWSDTDRRRLHAVAHEVFDRYEAEGRTGRRLLWERTKEDTLADLDQFLVRDDHYRAQHRVRPVRVEMAFGMDGAAPLTLRLPSGRELTFRGKADRVDTTADGTVMVSDYKTGNGTKYKKLGEDPVLAGTTLQLGLYAEAARQELGASHAHAQYWMATSKADFTRYGYPWTDDRRRRFLDVIDAVVDGIESGTFPARSGEYMSFFGKHQNCRYCEFDRVCPRDREDHERAKAAAPQLAVLGRLLPAAGAAADVRPDGDEQ